MSGRKEGSGTVPATIDKMDGEWSGRIEKLSTTCSLILLLVLRLESRIAVLRYIVQTEGAESNVLTEGEFHVV
jgi:hypothetical protein